MVSLDVKLRSGWEYEPELKKRKEIEEMEGKKPFYTSVGAKRSRKITRAV